MNAVNITWYGHNINLWAGDNFWFYMSDDMGNLVAWDVDNFLLLSVYAP
jgi:hypothetical protein